MRFPTTIALILVLSALGLTYEIAAGRVLAPFFGTSLLTWTAVIATILAGFSLGSALGGLVAEKDGDAAVRIVRTVLVVTAILMAVTPFVLGVVYAGGARETGGMLLAVVVAFFPASVLVSFPSPLLAKLAIEARPGREGSSLGLVLAAGSLGAIVGAILAGFVTLPLFGSVATFAGCGAVALLCIPFVKGAPPRTGGGGGEPDGQPGASVPKVQIGAASLAVLAGFAQGSVCQYESGLSCIDIVPQGSAVFMYSDRTQQAAERRSPQAGETDRQQDLVMPYTQWIWARMDRDLGPAASVLFIGGGGYSLPTTLLATRPLARAVAVEIDPLITEVVRRHLPGAGAMLDETGFDAGGPAIANEGRLGVVHADGRVFLNETDRRFDAAVMDAFSSGSVPAHLATLETYERLRQIVDGPVYVNLIDKPDGQLVRGVHAILTRLYPHVEAFQGPVSYRGRANVVLAASQDPFAPLATLPERYSAVEVTPGRAFTDDRGWVGTR